MKAAPIGFNVNKNENSIQNFNTPYISFTSERGSCLRSKIVKYQIYRLISTFVSARYACKNPRYIISATIKLFALSHYKFQYWIYAFRKYYVTNLAQGKRWKQHDAVAILPGVEYPKRLLGHTVHTPVRIPMVVADCYGKSAIIRSYQLYDFPFTAPDLQGFPFASVRRIVPVILHYIWNKKVNLSTSL